MAIITYLGLVAATLTASAFFPQVYKIWKTKETKDISMITFVMLVTSNVLWLIYGTVIKDIPILITNSVIFVLASIIIAFKIKYK